MGAQTGCLWPPGFDPQGPALGVHKAGFPLELAGWVVKGPFFLLSLSEKEGEAYWPAAQEKNG